VLEFFGSVRVFVSVRVFGNVRTLGFYAVTK
jgi:hypothetical protein